MPLYGLASGVNKEAKSHYGLADGISRESKEIYGFAGGVNRKLRELYAEVVVELIGIYLELLNH